MQARSTMPITYSLIARGPVVLCEAYVQPGSFTVIARKILHKVPERVPEKKSYGYEGWVLRPDASFLAPSSHCPTQPSISLHLGRAGADNDVHGRRADDSPHLLRVSSGRWCALFAFFIAAFAWCASQCSGCLFLGRRVFSFHRKCGSASLVRMRMHSTVPENCHSMIALHGRFWNAWYGLQY